MTRPRSAVAPIVAALAIVTLSLVLYVVGYFWLGERTWFQSPDREVRIERFYRHRWQAILFVPASQLESLVRGESVTLRYDGDGVRSGVI